MLKLKNISVSFDERKVLDDVSYNVPAGEVVTIVGHNGAGKSTLFDVIAGALHPDSGSVLLDGKDISAVCARKRALDISTLLQDTMLGSVSTMTVRENLALAALKGKRAGMRKGAKQFPSDVVDEILKPLGLGLEELLDVEMRKLSGGQRQIISFVMATLAVPKLLLLDEPTAALDPTSATKLLDFATAFIKKHDIATLLITHDVQVAQQFGRQCWRLEQGKLIVE